MSAVWLSVPRTGRRLREPGHAGGGQFGNRRARVVVPHEKPARALHEDEVAVGASDAHLAATSRRSSGAPAGRRRGGGDSASGNRANSCRSVTSVSRRTSSRSPVVRADTGLRRLDDRDPGATGRRERRDRRRDDGLADARPGAGDDQDAHRGSSVPDGRERGKATAATAARQASKQRQASRTGKQDKRGKERTRGGGSA